MQWKMELVASDKIVGSRKWKMEMGNASRSMEIGTWVRIQNTRVMDPGRGQ